MAEHDTLLNAVIGAVASIVLGFVPFSTVLGGAIAGYLEGGTRSDGLRVGAISGVLGLVVGAVFFFVVVLFFGVFAVGAGAPLAFSAFGVLFLLFGAVLSALYTVGLSALGGWLGNYAKYELDI
ncbi:DUF5518 domain-containing protein [Haloarcula sediminis]|uniref:DUF5518 domain-containing protein n=1 Tax=Haloarcula sediminis TaxID=3111777 RepID=UPI002D7824E6|nr:DUF5518 domain-containing protein [Haloarcula sp. CK38]